MLNATTTAGAQLRNLAIIVICIALLAGINVVFNDYIVRVISTIFIFMILAGLAPYLYFKRKNWL